MAYPTDPRFAQAGVAATGDGRGPAQHMLQVYNYMMLGLALTGIVAYVVGTTPGALRADLRHAR